MELATLVQIIGKALCVSLYANSFGKGMNPCVLPFAMDKVIEQTEFFKVVEVTNLGEGKLNSNQLYTI